MRIRGRRTDRTEERATPSATSRAPSRATPSAASTASDTLATTTIPDPSTTDEELFDVSATTLTDLLAVTSSERPAVER